MTQEDTTYFCKYLKLINGDNIVGLTQDNCNNLVDGRIVIVTDPMSVTPMRLQRLNQILETYVLHPWMPLTDSNVVEIQSVHIISAVEARDQFREQYENFVKQMNEEKDILDEEETSHNLLLAQEFLKNIAKTNIEEDNEQSDGDWNLQPGSRTIH